MKKFDFGMLLYALIAFGLAWSLLDSAIKAMMQTAILFGGIYIVSFTIMIYQMLKEVRFKVQYVSKIAWYHFFLVHIIVWPVWYILLPEKIFSFLVLFLILSALFLLVLDIAITIKKKLFR